MSHDREKDELDRVDELDAFIFGRDELRLNPRHDWRRVELEGMRRGDTHQIPLLVRLEPALPLYGNPPPKCRPPPVIQDVTAWTQFWFTAKGTVVQPDNLATFQLTLGAGIVVVNAHAGQLLATVPPIATRSQPDGVVRLVYDVQGKDGAGNIWTFQYGTLPIYPDVSRAIS
jgi:hypothetical protein